MEMIEDRFAVFIRVYPRDPRENGLVERGVRGPIHF
jgi:hypothetical protein